MLKTDRRKEVAEHLEYAKRLGDLSENAEYHQAREEQGEVEDRINRIENLLKNASIIAGTAQGGERVMIGSTVRVSKEGDNKSLVFTLVGSEEADMSTGKVSNLSPLGSALIGRKVGDVVSVSTPKGKTSYTIAALQ